MIAMVSAEAIARFWDKVEKTPAHWYWRGYRARSGAMPVFLGKDGHARRTMQAQLLAWQLTRGPLGDRQLRRICPEPLCIRPACHRRTWDWHPEPLTLPPPEPATPAPDALPPLPWLSPLTLARIYHMSRCNAIRASPATIARLVNLTETDVARILAGETLARSEREAL